MDEPVDLDTQIEDLVSDFPESVGFLIKNGVRCIRCGEPIWGSIGELLEEEGIADARGLIRELNAFLIQKK